jgi:hypothetical protein
MNFKYIAMVAVIAATLVGTMAITADSALAYENNQVISQINECGNYWFPVNVICSNLNSQAEGDENNVAMTTTTPTNPDTDSDTNSGPPFP